MPLKHVQILREMEELMDCRCNFIRYRNLLSRCDRPCFPYFGIFLRDCTFIDVGNPTHVEDLVNFEKMRLKGATIKAFSDFQTAHFPFSLEATLQNFLKNISAFEEPVLHKYSTQYERAADI